MAGNRIYYPQQPVFPLQKSSSINQPDKSAKSQVANGLAFAQVLQQEISGVQFSQHALQRLESRNIQFDQAELNKLNVAVEKAAQKGARESLVLMNNNLALVVSVKNKTVITAMDGASMKNNVFTNIDSAVIV
ncbi:MAG: TIGR02530 family flagellar biosynthesis protein [Veillonellales bacterium]